MRLLGKGHVPAIAYGCDNLLSVEIVAKGKLPHICVERGVHERDLGAVHVRQVGLSTSHDLRDEVGFESWTRASREAMAGTICGSFGLLIRLQIVIPEILANCVIVEDLLGYFVIRFVWKGRRHSQRNFGRDVHRYVRKFVVFMWQNVGVIIRMYCFRDWLWLE